MIKFLDLQKITERYSVEIHEAVSRVIQAGIFKGRKMKILR